MDSDSVCGIDRRRLLGGGGLAAAGVAAAGAPRVAAGAPLVGARPGRANPAPSYPGIPPDTCPDGAYDRYVAKLAAEGKFSGVVLLSHRGRTLLSRSYGMADKEKGIRNSEGIAFSVSSAGKPFHAVATLQLAQQGEVKLSDTVGTHLTGYAKDIAEQVTIHHLLSGTSGLSTRMRTCNASSRAGRRCTSTTSSGSGSPSWWRPLALAPATPAPMSASPCRSWKP
ncbi:beta-lactamase family protein [Streptomyces sp. NBC_01764]|uniref:serine hydrolase domain-containing protein n=1 Tax=Streptomyces sp. NBC_01764 TaxID=2975935 RepID=UPI002259BB1F|nr:serine hydrolase domain-containing protein [Streptomyces sp. NBC_01764]MCX4404014.1 beta-lactamase family protein [Streptomyces sp. NBC_01764]